VPVWLSEELADELRDATVAVIADTAHVPQLERPDAVDLLTAAFLARLELSLTGDA
jgi:pimeloyl-ACP methyl ester carboxylesterase